MELMADPQRSKFAQATGIYVRAKKYGEWDNVDIAELDTASLDAWLRSRDIEWPISVVMALLGHK